MILGLAKRQNDMALKTRKAAEGLFVVIDAYQGRYEYFEGGELPSPTANSVDVDKSLVQKVLGEQHRTASDKNEN